MCYKHLPVIQRGSLSGKHNCSEKQTLGENFSSGTAKIVKHFEHGEAVTDNLFVLLLQAWTLVCFCHELFQQTIVLYKSEWQQQRNTVHGTSQPSSNQSENLAYSAKVECIFKPFFMRLQALSALVWKLQHQPQGKWVTKQSKWLWVVQLNKH